MFNHMSINTNNNRKPYSAAIDLEYMDLEYMLIIYSNLRSEVDNNDIGSPIRLQLMELVYKCHELENENMELAVLKTMLSAVTSVSLQIHGDCLLQIVRTCYNIFLGSKNALNHAIAKSSLIQMMIIVFHRMEADSFF